MPAASGASTEGVALLIGADPEDTFGTLTTHQLAQGEYHGIGARFEAEDPSGLFYESLRYVNGGVHARIVVGLEVACK